ncbi:PQ loop repeat-domain-containing protein [Xylaria sp. CBS 124048]|nr:PQ loop repeat-domain-containing protein [Xylaria sp. CBS 124048]
MAPPPGLLNLDVEAISGTCGAISIAAWVVVFSPQIADNFRRSSTDGISVPFLLVWLLGDIFNIVGAVLQGVLPTMLVLAIYYATADVVLLAQYFYYNRGFPFRRDSEDAPLLSDPTNEPVTGGEPTESTALLDDSFEQLERQGTTWSHLSPAVPMRSDPPVTPSPTSTTVPTWSVIAVSMVCVAALLGWYLNREYSIGRPAGSAGELPALDLWGQIFGWLCAVFYMVSRLPQLFVNHRRKSAGGISVFFFLFACLGNLTYVLSIFAYEPVCRDSNCQPGEASQIYNRYLLVNASWLAGSLGTLLLDSTLFAQYFIYDRCSSSDEDENASNPDGGHWDQRPLLQRSH